MNHVGVIFERALHEKLELCIEYVDMHLVFNMVDLFRRGSIISSPI